MTFTAEDWPHGLRCSGCHHEFIPAQPMFQIPVGMSPAVIEGEPIVHVEIACMNCAIGLSEVAA